MRFRFRESRSFTRVVRSRIYIIVKNIRNFWTMFLTEQNNYFTEPECTPSYNFTVDDVTTCLKLDLLYEMIYDLNIFVSFSKFTRRSFLFSFSFPPTINFIYAIDVERFINI